MHELGIVFHIIKSVKDVGIENKVNHINNVTLEIGEVSGVVPSYLEDCWKWAVSKEELITDCSLTIEILKASTICNSCNKEYETIKYGKVCPYCNSNDTVLLFGNEVNIKDITVE